MGLSGTIINFTSNQQAYKVGYDAGHKACLEKAIEWLEEHIDQELEVYDVGMGGWHEMKFNEWLDKFREDVGNKE